MTNYFLPTRRKLFSSFWRLCLLHLSQRWMWCYFLPSCHLCSVDVLLFLGHLAFIFIFFSSEKRLQFLQFSVPNQTCHSRGIAAASNAALERYAPPSSHNKSEATTTTSCHSKVNGIKDFLHPCFLSWNHFTDKTQTSRSASAREGILDYLYSFCFFFLLCLLSSDLDYNILSVSTAQTNTRQRS